MLAADTMEALHIPRGSYVVKVNNRKVLDGAMDRVHIPAEKRLTTMRAIDKLDRLGIEGVKMLLGRGRKTKAATLQKAPSSRIRKSQASSRQLPELQVRPATQELKAKKSFRKLPGWCEQLVMTTEFESTKLSFVASSTTQVPSTKLS